MKKLLLLIFIAAFISPTMKAQNCRCSPVGAGWQPFVALIKNQSRNVKCGYQFSLNCLDTITLRSIYKCVGDCAAKYSAVLKNAAGTVIQSYPSFNFPWSYRFMAAGSYSLEITPLCGNNKCEPCRFFFTVTCTPTTASCDCKPDGWQSLVATVNKVPQKVTCGFQFSIKRNSPVKLDGKYFCNGSCVATYTAVLKNNLSGAVVMNYPSFSFPWNYTFAAAGSFKLEIIPVCGDKRCQPCVFYFTVQP